ncbi:MAG: hypothetical protein FWE57_10505 [Chitinispirillia bacterium]|nr:hypothetical protein [Chitinispirillia bacterium]
MNNREKEKLDKKDIAVRLILDRHKRKNPKGSITVYFDKDGKVSTIKDESYFDI